MLSAKHIGGGGRTRAARLGVTNFKLRHYPGSLLLDSLLAGDLPAFVSALQHLALPVLCLVIVIVIVIVIAGPVIKQTRALAVELMSTDHVRYARICGFSPRRIRRMMLRSALVPWIAFAGTELMALFATGSLIEFVFARAGLGWWGLNAIACKAISRSCRATC